MASDLPTPTRLQIGVIMRALISLLQATYEIQGALLEVSPSQSDEFRHHVEASARAMEECQTQLQILLDRMYP
jgi:hypothetical protein